MISILLMTVFSETDPMVFKPGKTTTDFARIGPMDALASVSNKIGDVHTRAEKAQTYIDALKEAATAKQTDVTVQKESLKFKISAFTATGTRAVMKFAKEGFQTILSCFIDLKSVGKTADDVTDASKVDAGWLNYFWNLWNGKDATFKAAYFTPDTQNDINNLGRDSKNGPAFSDIKGLTPRYDEGLSQQEVSSARAKEMDSLIPALLRMNRMGIDIPKIVTAFREKIWGLLGKPQAEGRAKVSGPLDLAKPGTLEAFASDDKPSRLQLDFWKVFWQDTMVKIVSDGLDQKQADDLTAKSLAAIDELAEQYRIS